MPDLDYSGWPSDRQEDRKPFNRLMPFHRIRVPAKQIILPRASFQAQIISGDGYSVGARSTKDYDAKFGEDLGKELAEFVEKIFPILQLGKVVTQGLREFINRVPLLNTLLKPLSDALDGFDPFVELFKFFGSRLDALLVDSFIRSIPAWVPTFDEGFHPDIQLLELDGILIRSHQRYDSVPFWQWHRWYDWRFALVPSPVFSEIVGFGNAHRDDDNAALEEVRQQGPQGQIQFKFVNYNQEGRPVGSTVSAASVIDCEWDIGAIGLEPGPFITTFNPPAKHDWCWPMAGMFFWAIGRSVYDCSHATANEGRRTKKPDRKPQGSQLPESERLKRGVHLNQLHPLKAIATARWEAFQFKENPKPVPAIQLMFFANNQLSSAGFFDTKSPQKSGFNAINDQDYQFIVDLPPVDVTKKREYPIGHTPDFALNTLVLRPRLVVDANFEPFQNAGGIVEDSDEREKNEVTPAKNGPKPIVQLIIPKADEPPQQALVTIPLKEVSSEINSYGVLLSIGWADPDATQVKNVKKVTVKLVSLQPAKDLHESGDAEWNLNVGINGRWFQFRFLVKNLDRIQIDAIAGGPVIVEMLLAEQDFVMVSVHGMEEDPFDDLIRKPPEFKPPDKRPPKNPGSLTLQNFTDEVKAALIKLTLKDRLLRHHGEVKVPTGPPDPLQGGAVPSKSFSVPLIGREIEWNQDVDTDDDHQASLAGRAMFLRLAAGNHFDANDLLGMIDSNVPDPARKDPNKSPRRSQDITDTPNPLVVGDILKEVGPGVFKKCQLSAYATEVVGRMGTIAYQPDVLEYTVFYEVKVENLPE
jgi:hypothetical protein